jgi:hypothetical protein
MFKVKLYQKIDGVYTQMKGNSVFPLGVGELLDEQLDEAFITIYNSELENIPPLTDIRVDIYENDILKKQIYMVVAQDKAQRYPLRK